MGPDLQSVRNNMKKKILSTYKLKQKKFKENLKEKFDFSCIVASITCYLLLKADVNVPK
jgi:hypothetical protein